MGWVYSWALPESFAWKGFRSTLTLALRRTRGTLGTTWFVSTGETFGTAESVPLRRIGGVPVTTRFVSAEGTFGTTDSAMR